MTIRYATAVVAVLILPACGGGGAGTPISNNHQTDTSTPTSQQTSPVQPKRRNPVAAESASFPFTSHEPINTDASGTFAFVGGAEITALLQWMEGNCTLFTAGTCNTWDAKLQQQSDRAETWHFLMNDGTSKSRLVDYLVADTNDRQGAVVRWQNPPTVRMEQGSSSDQEAGVRMAVRILNSALPFDWQIRFSDQRAGSFNYSRGDIIVSFAAQHRNRDDGIGDALGIAWSQLDDDESLAAGLVWINEAKLPNERDRIEVILHELLHTLGRGHVPETRFFDTIMHTYAGSQADLLVMHQLDYDALLAVHNRLSAGTPVSDIYTKLGEWTETSNHLFGRIGYVPGQLEAVLYGAVGRNGLVRPWAFLAIPSPPLERGLGTANWSGRVLGLTPDLRPVSGDVGMMVHLDRLTGNLTFTDLEMWKAGSVAGVEGTGVTWGDGDLRYDIAVYENAFRETGGDAGRITGVFGGQNHDNAAGTLRRSDLAAGFGAERR